MREAATVRWRRGESDATLPTAIASYSLVGEKLEHSLEPLLAAPVTDGEILLGKCLAAVLPPLAAIYAGVVVFMALCDLATGQRLSRLYFPNWTAAVILLVVVPLTAAMCVEFNVVISARVSDVRAAQQLGALAVVPFAAIYVGSEIGLVTLDRPTLAVIAGILAVVDVALFFASRATFQREQILTRWR
jgi:ABC-2 type transport system permease protein